MASDIIEQLKREIAGYQREPGLEAVGIVVEVGDGIARISGLAAARSQELLDIETARGTVAALAFNLEEGSVGAVVLGDPRAVSIGDRARLAGRVLAIRAGPELIGRVLDPLGNQLDGKGAMFTDPNAGTDYRLERSAPPVVAREPVNTPLHTGIKAIDAMIPIGRGQRELLIGDRKTGKTSIALDAILNQTQDPARRPVVAVYVAIGKKQSEVARTIELLRARGALGYTIVVAAPASAPAALQYLAPFAGCALGEYFMDRGRDALLVYDDLSKHADAYRELSLLLRRPPGRDAYPGDIFYLHARLLERAAKLNREHGGGSLTALPIIETKLGDVSAYIPTNVISITDGQIYLEPELFHRGLRPALNIGLSVSRVGSAAQTKAMRQVAGRLRLELAQFRELEAFVQFASDLDAETRAKIRRGELLSEVLKQTDGEPVPFEAAVVVLYAAAHGLLDDVPLGSVRAFERSLLDYLGKLHDATVQRPIRETGDLDAETEAKLTSAIAEFKAVWEKDTRR